MQKQLGRMNDTQVRKQEIQRHFLVEWGVSYVTPSAQEQKLERHRGVPPPRTKVEEHK